MTQGQKACFGIWQHCIGYGGCLGRRGAVAGPVMLADVVRFDGMLGCNTAPESDFSPVASVGWGLQQPDQSKWGLS